MKKFAIASIVLMALPVAGMAAGSEKITGHQAGTAIDQSNPGSALSVSENAASKHLAAAAAHEQTAMHHKAAADAQSDEEKIKHAREADQAALVAGEKTKEAVLSTLGK